MTSQNIDVRIAFKGSRSLGHGLEDDDEATVEPLEDEYDLSPNGLDSKAPVWKEVDIVIVETEENVRVVTRQFPWSYQWL